MKRQSTYGGNTNSDIIWARNVIDLFPIQFSLEEFKVANAILRQDRLDKNMKIRKQSAPIRFVGGDGSFAYKNLNDEDIPYIERGGYTFANPNIYGENAQNVAKQIDDLAGLDNRESLEGFLNFDDKMLANRRYKVNRNRKFSGMVRFVNSDGEDVIEEASEGQALIFVHNRAYVNPAMQHKGDQGAMEAAARVDAERVSRFSRKQKISKQKYSDDSFIDSVDNRENKLRNAYNPKAIKHIAEVIYDGWQYGKEDIDIAFDAYQAICENIGSDDPITVEDYFRSVKRQIEDYARQFGATRDEVNDTLSSIEDHIESQIPEVPIESHRVSRKHSRYDPGYDVNEAM